MSFSRVTHQSASLKPPIQQPVPKVTAPQNQSWLNKTNVIAGLSAVILGGAALCCYKSGCFSGSKTIVVDLDPAGVIGPLGNYLPGFVNKFVSLFDCPVKYSHFLNVGLYASTLSSASILSVSIVAVPCSVVARR